jgi:DNA-binding XRE family transcriptional regulator
MEQFQIKEFQNALIDTLKQERQRVGMSHEKLSEKAGVTRQTIGKIEAGLSNPTMLTMFRIAFAMGMSLEELVRKMGK